MGDTFNTHQEEDFFGTKTSSTDSKSNSKTTGDSQVQDGEHVKAHDTKLYEKSDEQQEYIDDANNNTEVANENPVQGDKPLVG